MVLVCSGATLPAASQKRISTSQLPSAQSVAAQSKALPSPVPHTRISTENWPSMFEVMPAASWVVRSTRTRL